MRNLGAMREEIGNGYFRLNIEPGVGSSPEADSEVRRLVSTYFEQEFSTPIARASCAEDSKLQGDVAAARNPCFGSSK